MGHGGGVARSVAPRLLLEYVHWMRLPHACVRQVLCEAAGRAGHV